MMQIKSPKKFTLIYQKDQNDLYITDWSNPNQFSSLVRSLFSLPSNSAFFLMDIMTNSIFDLAAFFSLEQYSSSTFQVIPTSSTNAQTPNKLRSNIASGSHYGSSGAADFGGRESSPYYITAGGSGIINVSRNNMSNNQIHTNPRASRSASYDMNQNFKYNNNNSAINSNTNNNTIMHFDDTPPNMSRVIHDFEAFMHDSVPVNYYCMLFFDDQDQLKGFGNQLAKQITQPFPSLQVYYSLYPSKRSRGAFVPSDSPYLLQLYHQKEMIFERELSINEPISSDLIDAIANYIKNTPKSSSIATQQDHLFTNEQQHTQPSNFFNIPSKHLIHSQSQANQILHEFKSDESPNLMSQDIVFELVEVVCSSRFRDLFDDDEFKYILKQVRKKNPDLTSAYQNFKLFNDESEFEQSLKQVAAKYDKRMTPAKIDVSFENKEKRSSLKKLKRAQQNSQDKKKWDLKTYKGIRKFLRDYNKNGILSVEDASIIVYCSHPNNHNNREFQNIIDSLENFNNPNIILKILQGYGREISSRIIQKYFEKKEAEQINKSKDDVLSPICGAFMNLRALGNIDEFLEILTKNLECFDQKDTSFSNNNPINSNNITNSNSNNNLFNNNNNNNNTATTQSKSHIPFAATSAKEICGNQQPPLYQARMSRTDIQQVIMQAIPESNEIHERSTNQRESNDHLNAQEIIIDPATQTTLFAYSQIAKKKSGERRPTFSLGLNNGNNIPRTRSDSRRGSTKVQSQDQQVTDIIDKFHQAKDQMEFDERFFEALRKLRNNVNLTQNQDILCDKMYYNRYQEFLEILDKIIDDPYYLKSEPNRTEIIKLIESKANDLNDEEEESPLSKSPKVKNRKDKYLKFKNLLNFLFEKKGLLSLKEFNTFNFLYTKEDINVLSAFEVYMHNQDIQDFTQTLKLIDQLYFFKSYLDYEEIESFDESTNKQLSILFYLRNYISYDQAQVYEKLIRFGDSLLIDLYLQFKEKRNKQEFIEKVIFYAEKRQKELCEAEQRVKEQKSTVKTEQINMRQLVDTFHDRLMQDVHYVEIVHELIENDNPIMKAINEVYNYQKDKQELVQNVTLLYKHHFFKKLEEKTNQALGELQFNRNQVLKIKEKIQNRDITLVAAFNSFLEDKNEEEFRESVYHLQY